MHRTRTRGVPRALGSVLPTILCTPIISFASASHAAPEPVPTATAARSERPRLVWGAATSCLQDPEGRRIRVQCQDLSPADPVAEPPPPADCWVAFDCRDRSAPAATCARIERTSWCHDLTYQTDAYQALVSEGHRMVEADPEVQPGWYRDDEGRAFQVVFDLNRRYWIGIGWAMSHDERAGTNPARVALGAGFRIDDLDGDLKGKTRYTFLDGHVALAPFEVRATAFRFDRSVWGNDPFLRITTFVGKPRRHDIEAAIGGWGEAGVLEHRPRGSEQDTNLRFLAGGLTWDLWQDADMTSYFRLRTGVGLEEHFIGGGDHGRFAITPIGAVEGEFTFDDAGFHHLTWQSTIEAPLGETGIPDDTRLASHIRFANALAYELILIAIDDQPVTLRAEVTGGYRDDLTDSKLNGWEVAAEVGLRVSLWAPARDLAARDAARALRARGTK